MINQIEQRENAPLQGLYQLFGGSQSQCHEFIQGFNREIKLFKCPIPSSSFFTKKNLEDILWMEEVGRYILPIPHNEKILTAIKNLKKKKSIDEFILTFSNAFKLWSLQLYSEKLKRLSCEIFSLFKFPVDIGVWVTKGIDKQGYPLHVDAGCSVIKQISGKKEWFFPIDKNMEILKDYQGFTMLTSSSDHRKAFFKKIKGHRSFILNAGDCLHYSAGQPHFAISRSKAPSIHLNIMIFNHQVYDLKSFMQQNVRDHESCQCIEESEIASLEEKMKDIENKWERYLDKRDRSILKKGLINAPSYYTDPFVLLRKKHNLIS